MSSRNVFIDTSGFFAVLIRNDPNHDRAVGQFRSWREAGRYAFTTDYVADETATLLKARGAGQLIASFFRLLESSEVLSFLFVHEERFRKARDFFLKHDDHGYSFTDCTSFLLMKELGLHDALTADEHFEEAGFNGLLV
ncbi:MAG TPA: PIN domain-containing protein [Verrucomicrobiae bacterium]|nr:PIN domain-containing protein [Verrucomicrobiae bacterium]